MSVSDFKDTYNTWTDSTLNKTTTNTPIATTQGLNYFSHDNDDDDDEDNHLNNITLMHI